MDTVYTPNEVNLELKGQMDYFIGSIHIEKSRFLSIIS